jgi:hypothetical protein
VEHEGDFWMEPILILEWKFKVFKNEAIGIVNVQWNYYHPEDATWEHEENIQLEYLQFFVNFEENNI